MLGFGTIAWRREARRLAVRGALRASIMTYAITPLILMLGVITLVGTLVAEHASLTVFL